MSDPGFVDLIVRYRDVVTDKGVALDTLTGTVKNAQGIVIETITPVAYGDVDGTYYGVLDYDVRDASKFAGLSLTVDWVGARYGVVLPTVEKAYGYAPAAADYVDKTILYWYPLDPPNNIFFYDVHRIKNDGTDVFVGRSFGPSFVDATVFANEFEARSWLYKIYPYCLTKQEGLEPDGSDYKKQGSVLEPYFVGRTGADTCTLTGKIADVMGRAVSFPSTKIENSSVVFKVNWRDRWQFVQHTLISGEDVYVSVTSTGDFTVVLLQDVVVEITVPMINFAARFIVPRQSQVALGDLDLEILRE